MARPALSLPRSPSSSPPMCGIASSAVAGATALITGGADNGEGARPGKGRRGEVRRRWVQTAEKLESTLKEVQGHRGVLC